MYRLPPHTRQSDTSYRYACFSRIDTSPLSVEQRCSDPTAVVPSGPVIAYPNGTFIDETISVETGAITYTDVPSPPAYTYQWIHVDANGTKEGNISGATSGAYTLVQADNQKYIQIKVSYISTATGAGVTR